MYSTVHIICTYIYTVKYEYIPFEGKERSAKTNTTVYPALYSVQSQRDVFLPCRRGVDERLFCKYLCKNQTM